MTKPRICVIEIVHTSARPSLVKEAIEDALSDLFENRLSEIDGCEAQSSVGHYVVDA